MKVMVNHSRYVISELWQKNWWNKFRAMFFTNWSLFDAWWLHHLMSLNLRSKTTQSNKLCWNLNIYICVCVCVCVCRERERERERAMKNITIFYAIYHIAELWVVKTWTLQTHSIFLGNFFFIERIEVTNLSSLEAS